MSEFALTLVGSSEGAAGTAAGAPPSAADPDDPLTLNLGSNEGAVGFSSLEVDVDCFNFSSVPAEDGFAELSLGLLSMFNLAKRELTPPEVSAVSIPCVVRTLSSSLSAPFWLVLDSPLS